MDIVKNIQRTHEVLTPAGPVNRRRPRLGGQAFSDDLRGLSPLIYTHINPYGRFEVDLDRRIDFERKAA